MKIALGTTSVQKTNSIQKVVAGLDIVAELINCDVDSGVSEQPNTKGETKQGAINRAKSALKMTESADFALGVEFGYEPDESGGYKMLCIAAIATADNHLYIEQSSTLQLPKMFQQALQADVEIDDVLEDAISKLEGTQLKREAIHFIKKRRVVEECVKNVLIRYLLREVWY